MKNPPSIISIIPSALLVLRKSNKEKGTMAFNTVIIIMPAIKDTNAVNNNLKTDCGLLFLNSIREYITAGGKAIKTEI